MKFRIKNKKKFNRFIVLSITLLTIFTYFFSTTMSDPYVEGKSDKNDSVIVKSGETLWSIAENIETDKDIREVVYEIQEINNINNSRVYPGDKIYIPID